MMASDEPEVVIKRIKAIAKGSEYVKDWQYSQGYFDVNFTDDPFQAEDFSDSPGPINTFFPTKNGHRIVEITLVATITEINNGSK